MEEKIRKWADELCRCAGMDDGFSGGFRERLSASPAVSEEFQYYCEHRDFLCKNKINGYTIIDIMVWKLDRFKSELDRDKEGKRNSDRMVLEAFDTMLQMEKEPEKYRNFMLNDTGTDYYGKY